MIDTRDINPELLTVAFFKELKKEIKMTREEANIKLTELTNAVHDALDIACKFADEHKLCFDLGIGGWYNNPAFEDYETTEELEEAIANGDLDGWGDYDADQCEGWWQASSIGC